MVVKFRQKKSRLFTVTFYIILFLLNFSKNSKSRHLSAHIGETFYCFRKALDGLICIAMFNAIAERVAVNEVDNNLYSFLLAKNLSICFTIILSYVILFLQH